MIARLIIAGIFALSLVGAGGALAQMSTGIAIVVNDEIISTRDIDSRVGLIAAMTGAPNDPTTVRRIRDQAGRSLIDEMLELQEAKRKNVGITQEDVDKALAAIAKENNVPPERFGDFLRQSGIDIDTLTNQIRAELAWQRLLQQKVMPTIIISDDEIDRAITKAKASIGLEELLLAEIFLSVDSPDQEEDVRRVAERLVEQLKDSRNFQQFPALARQYSQGLTAQQGGDLGWVQPGTLSDEADTVLAKTSPGQVTDPVRTVSGFYIYALRDRRKIAAANPDEVTVQLSQIVFAPPATQIALEEAMNLAQSVPGKIKTCADVEPVGRELGAVQSGDAGMFKLSQLPPPVRDAVRDVVANTASKPVRSDRGIYVFIVCARNEQPAAAFNPDRVREAIVQRRIGMAARRYLRDLRRDAIIEYR